MNMWKTTVLLGCLLAGSLSPAVWAQDSDAAPAEAEAKGLPERIDEWCGVVVGKLAAVVFYDVGWVFGLRTRLAL